MSRIRVQQPHKLMPVRGDYARIVYPIGSEGPRPSGEPRHTVSMQEIVHHDPRKRRPRLCQGHS
jgi:hypothetical protein